MKKILKIFTEESLPSIELPLIKNVTIVDSINGTATKKGLIYYLPDFTTAYSLRERKLIHDLLVKTINHSYVDPLISMDVNESLAYYDAVGKVRDNNATTEETDRYSEIGVNTIRVRQGSNNLMDF